MAYKKDLTISFNNTNEKEISEKDNNQSSKEKRSAQEHRKIFAIRNCSTEEGFQAVITDTEQNSLPKQEHLHNDSSLSQEHSNETWQEAITEFVSRKARECNLSLEKCRQLLQPVIANQKNIFWLDNGRLRVRGLGGTGRPDDSSASQLDLPGTPEAMSLDDQEFKDDYDAKKNSVHSLFSNYIKVFNNAWQRHTEVQKEIAEKRRPLIEKIGMKKDLTKQIVDEEYNQEIRELDESKGKNKQTEDPTTELRNQVRQLDTEIDEVKPKVDKDCKSLLKTKKTYNEFMEGTMYEMKCLLDMYERLPGLKKELEDKRDKDIKQGALNHFKQWLEEQSQASNDQSASVEEQAAKNIRREAPDDQSSQNEKQKRPKTVPFKDSNEATIQAIGTNVGDNSEIGTDMFSQSLSSDISIGTNAPQETSHSTVGEPNAPQIMEWSIPSSQDNFPPSFPEEQVSQNLYFGNQGGNRALEVFDTSMSDNSNSKGPSTGENTSNTPGLSIFTYDSKKGKFVDSSGNIEKHRGGWGDRDQEDPLARERQAHWVKSLNELTRRGQDLTPAEEESTKQMIKDQWVEIASFPKEVRQILQAQSWEERKKFLADNLSSQASGSFSSNAEGDNTQNIFNTEMPAIEEFNVTDFTQENPNRPAENVASFSGAQQEEVSTSVSDSQPNNDVREQQNRDLRSLADSAFGLSQQFDQGSKEYQFLGDFRLFVDTLKDTTDTTSPLYQSAITSLEKQNQRVQLGMTGIFSENFIRQMEDLFRKLRNINLSGISRFEE